jgi:hypothetical protein
MHEDRADLAIRTGRAVGAICDQSEPFAGLSVAEAATQRGAVRIGVHKGGEGITGVVNADAAHLLEPLGWDRVNNEGHASTIVAQHAESWRYSVITLLG